jgi:molybdopterin/thiamine biosynthesis adenylyltransferase/rhodanese-related sulfurtransferase
MPSSAEVLRTIKHQIVEVDANDLPQATIVDVREADEWATGHIPGAIHCPRSMLESRIEGLVPDHDRPLLLYCQSGNRSAWATRTLLDDLGYRSVVSLRGGLDSWKQSGRAIEQPNSLSAEQRDRYSRHLLLPEIGEVGQQRLLAAKVLILGAGGLGSPVALYLAAAGVGTLGIVDGDVVDRSNLQRQIIHTNDRIGELKTASAKAAITQLNPDVTVIEYPYFLDRSNIAEIIAGYDIIVDGLDNFPARYLLNDASVRAGIPVVSAAILGFDGQLSVFIPDEGPCYRCLFPTPPPADMAPTCGTHGVVGVLPGVMGLLQATEVIKLLVKIGQPLVGRLLLYDALDARIDTVNIQRDPDCPICSGDPSEIDDDELGVFPDYEAFCAMPLAVA